MVEGRIRKFYEEVVLTEAGLRHEPGPDRRADARPNRARRCEGLRCRSLGFVRLGLGEGVDKARTTSPLKWPPSQGSLKLLPSMCFPLDELAYRPAWQGHLAPGFDFLR